MATPSAVYVVTWETNTQSINGEVCGVAGVALSEDGARRIAEGEAKDWREMRPEATVVVAGVSEPTDDWDIWIEWASHRVQS